MNDALKIPGLSNAWTMPIKGRIDMLTTGIRTPVGLKIPGADLDVIEEIGIRVENLLAPVRGRAASSPSGRAGAISSTSNGTGRSWPATA